MSKNGKIKADADRSTALAGAVGTYTLLVTNLRNGCSQTDEMVVTANRPDNAIITVKLPNCDSEIGSIQILGASGGKPPYSYTLKDWQAFSKKIPDSENVPIGTYIVRIKDANDCEFKTTAEVKAPSKPKGTLSPKDPQIFEKDSVKLSLTVEAKSPLSEIIWKSKDTTYRLVDNFSIWAAPATSSLYKVYLKDVNGCKDSLENWVFVKELSEVFIPNIFSPNGDGANDFFTVFANDRTAVKVVKFEVFNRWGELVFANRNFNPNVESEGWDGRFNGKLLNPAVFVYVVQVEFVGGRTKTYKGDITLTPE
jgi:gliding motility-associated-like protein